jgi:ABC-type transport system involved in cytochrome c biogenesis ATPase subunit
MLSLNDLLFGDNQGRVLGKLNTTLSSGLTWVTGEEGVGKTTLLRGLAS